MDNEKNVSNTLTDAGIDEEELKINVVADDIPAVAKAMAEGFDKNNLGTTGSIAGLKQ